jgi:DNA-binding phage protein
MKRDDYTSRQSAKDAEYEREYQAWIDSMTIDERREAERLGLLKPCLQRHGNGSATGDSADSPLMRIGDDPALMAPAADAQETAAETHVHDVADVLRHFVADLISEGNTRLTVECLAVALGLCAYNGESMTSIAKRHGVTRAAVSKRCVDITQQLNLPPSRAMRSEMARKIYRNSQLKRNQSRKP